MMLAGYGGMVSLAQLTVAGFTAYLVAILGDNSVGVMGLGWPWWLTVPVAILAGAVLGALIGAIAVRTEGIYTIMITLAIAVVLFFFVRQNYVIFNGWTGFAGIEPPTLFGIYWRDPVPFYYLSLAVAGFFFCAVVYISRSTFGLGLQAIRDNPRQRRANAHIHHDLLQPRHLMEVAQPEIPLQFGANGFSISIQEACHQSSNDSLQLLQ